MAGTELCRSTGLDVHASRPGIALKTKLIQLLDAAGFHIVTELSKSNTLCFPVERYAR